MRLPNLPYAGKKTKRSTIQWSGLNRRALISDNELSSTTNASTKNSPLLSPRPSREALYTLGTGNALFTGPQLAWVDGTDFKYNNVSKGVVTSSVKYMVDFNGKIIIFPDKKSYDYIADSFATFGSGTYPTAGSVPNVDYVCVLDNRIWAVKGDDIYSTALGDHADWTTFSSPSEATDAYHVDTGFTGDFTGIATYKGTIIAFKRDHMLKLFGDIPSNFQFIRITDLGCVSHKSIKEVNNVLFYLGPKGVYAYTGGLPDLISENLDENYVSAVAGGDKRRYYLSLYNGSSYKLYVYDTWYNTWLQEDTLQVKDFAYLNGYVYALAADNKIYKFNSGTETVTWEVITKQFTEEILGKKGHSQLNFRVDLEEDSTLTVSTKINNGEWAVVKTYSTENLSSFIAPVKINRADHFQIKLSCVGEGKIYAMERIFYVGSEI